MRIALVNPPLARRYVSGVDEPLSLEYLAAQVRGEHDVSIVDSLGTGLTVQETIEQLRELNPDIVGVSLTFTAAHASTLAICAGVKAASPGTLTLVGGNTATFLAEDLARLPEIDLVVRGEGDVSFRRTIAALEDGISLRGIPGLTYRLDGGIVDTGDPLMAEDIDRLPFPARDLLPFEAHYRKSILAARGCPYGCIYCSTSAFWNRRYRTRSIESITEEVSSLLSRKEIEYFAFADDCFTLSAERTFRICDVLESLGRRVSWSCTGRIETVNAELLKRMSSAGCISIFFGVESGSRRVLECLGRNYGPDDVERVYGACLANGITPSFSYIVGLPFAAEADQEDTFRLIQQLDGIENGVHILTPFPGTPIALRPEEFGIRILPHTMEELDINTRSVIDTRHLSSEQTQESFKKGLGYCFRALRRSRHKNAVLSRCSE